MELIEKRRKHFAALRAQEKRNRPPTKAQKRTQMPTYLKHMEKKVEGSEETAKGSRKKMLRRKRTGKEQHQESSKKQKVEKEKESDKVEEVELKKLLVIKKDEDIVTNAIPLATKLPVIIDYMLLKEVHPKTCVFGISSHEPSHPGGKPDRRVSLRVDNLILGEEPFVFFLTTDTEVTSSGYQQFGNSTCRAGGIPDKSSGKSLIIGMSSSRFPYRRGLVLTSLSWAPISSEVSFSEKTRKSHPNRYTLLRACYKAESILFLS
ncbi:hypothetical protein Tco_0980664 [Tanacetum coccineum]